METLKKELKGSYNFFIDLSNYKKDSPGYGLSQDKFSDANLCSIASVGYKLSALVIGVENDWLDYDKAKIEALRTLKTIANLEKIEGFYYHFIDINSGLRKHNSEISTIDTSIMIAGCLLVGQYFGDEVYEIADSLYKKINFPWIVDKRNNQFYFGYKKEQGFFGYWDYYAEQLMLYILGAGSPTYPIGLDVYNSFVREKGNYKENKDIIYSWFGSLFTYQLSHAWLDFRNKIDRDGINWFDNSIKATLANRDFCIDYNHQYPSFNENSWGITACVYEKGYQGEHGAEPAHHNIYLHNDGTIAPYGAVSSIVFTPEHSINALKHYYSIPYLVGKYGLKAAYRIDQDKKVWYSEDFLGIDKGLTMLMIDNYLNQNTWKILNGNEYIKKCFKRLEFKNR